MAPESESPVGPNANVLERLKGLSASEIKKIAQANAFPAAILLENLQGDLNFSNIVRTAAVMGFDRVYYTGEKRRWDRRGAVGMQNYIDIQHFPSIQAMVEDGTIFSRWVVGVDNTIPDDYGSPPEPYYDYFWIPNSLLIFGCEATGISKDLWRWVNEAIYIPQYGVGRSLNVATAAGIIMADYVAKNYQVLGKKEL